MGFGASSPFLLLSCREGNRGPEGAWAARGPCDMTLGVCSSGVAERSGLGVSQPRVHVLVLFTRRVMLYQPADLLESFREMGTVIISTSKVVRTLGANA